MSSMTVSSPVNAGARLDRLPVGAFHRRMLLLIGAGLFLDSFDVYLAGGVLASLVKSGWSTVDLNATFISATFAGMLLGAWFGGVLGDRYGRRFSYQLNLAIFGLASLAAVFAPDMQTLIVLRFIMGIGLGAELVIGYATLTEFIPPGQRGRWLALLSLISNSALFFSSVLGLWIIPNIGWQYMFAIVGVGAIIVWLMRKSMPESPRWLESVGRYDEAERVLSKIEQEASGGKPLPPVAAVPSGTERTSSAEHRASVLTLFTSQWISRTLIGMLIFVVIGFLLYGFVAWLPTFFVRQGVSIASSLLWTTVMSLGGPVGALIAMLLADRVGRKPVMIVAGLAAAGFGFCYPIVGEGIPLMIVGFCLVTSIFVLVATGYAVYVPELFPTQFRLRGTGVSSTTARLVSMFTPFLIVSVFNWGGIQMVVGLLVGILLFQTVILALFGTETKDRTLEEIAAAPPLEQPQTKTATV